MFYRLIDIHCLLFSIGAAVSRYLIDNCIYNLSVCVNILHFKIPCYLHCMFSLNCLMPMNDLNYYLLLNNLAFFQITVFISPLPANNVHGYYRDYPWMIFNKSRFDLMILNAKYLISLCRNLHFWGVFNFMVHCTPVLIR